MKNLIIILSIALIGCQTKQEAREILKNNMQSNCTVMIIDSCEYIVSSNNHGYEAYGYMAHKGNCKNHPPPLTKGSTN